MIKGDKSKYSSQQRVVDIYIRLLSGENINVSNLSFEYGKHPETIKDDIKNLRIILEQQQNSIIYNAKNNTYSLKKDNEFLNSGDILILLMLLYQSRSLVKDERLEIERKLIGLFPLEEQQKLNKFFRSYNYHYSTVQEKNMRKKINDLFYAILEQRQVTFLYIKASEIKERRVKPLTINFHDHQFYLLANFVGKNFDQPTPFRLDKIEKIQILDERFQLNKSSDYFKPGKYSNQSYNMYSGEEVTVKLKVDRSVDEYVYRTFPIVNKVNSDDEDMSIFEINVLGTKGILFWILGQRDRVEVLSPKVLRDEVKEIITKMLKKYEE